MNMYIYIYIYVCIYLKAYALPPTPERTRRFQSLCDLVGLFLVFTYVCIFVSWLEAMRTDGL